MIPHKFQGETQKDAGWYKGWNPRICVNCGKSSGHPIHRKKFRNKPLSYQLYMESKNGK
jgi:hypothetical protein